MIGVPSKIKINSDILMKNGDNNTIKTSAIILDIIKIILLCNLAKTNI